MICVFFIDQLSHRAYEYTHFWYCSHMVVILVFKGLINFSNTSHFCFVLYPRNLNTIIIQPRFHWLISKATTLLCLRPDSFRFFWNALAMVIPYFLLQQRNPIIWAVNINNTWQEHHIVFAYFYHSCKISTQNVISGIWMYFCISQFFLRLYNLLTNCWFSETVAVPVSVVGLLDFLSKNE